MFILSNYIRLFMSIVYILVDNKCTEGEEREREVDQEEEVGTHPLPRPGM